jgi:hypothetical protein
MRADWLSARHGDQAIEKAKTAMAERADIERLTEIPSMRRSEWPFAKGRLADHTLKQGFNYGDVWRPRLPAAKDCLSLSRAPPQLWGCVRSANSLMLTRLCQPSRVSALQPGADQHQIGSARR